MSDQRGSVLDALRRHPDPAQSRDPEIRAVVDALGQLDIAVEPDEQFRHELRAQLVAVAPRLMTEGAEDAAAVPAPSRARRRHAEHASPRGRSFARPLTMAASVIVLLALVLGGATWLSQKSLPGGTLYGLKRASESVRLAFASSSTDAAGDRLQFAATRVEEARKLLHQPTASALGRGPQADGGVSAATAKLVDQTLTSADNDVLAASRELTANAVTHKSGAPLATMITWAPGQAARLRELAAAAPTSGLRARATESQTLVTAALTRAEAVQPLAACTCMGTAHSDRFGPLPCTSCGAAPVSPGTASGGAATTSVPGAPAARRSAGAKGQGGATARNGSAGSNSGRTATPTRVPLPTLPTPHAPKLHVPTPSASVPIKINSCGVSISVGPIGVHVGSCPTPHG